MSRPLVRPILKPSLFSVPEQVFVLELTTLLSTINGLFKTGFDEMATAEPIVLDPSNLDDLVDMDQTILSSRLTLFLRAAIHSGPDATFDFQLLSEQVLSRAKALLLGGQLIDERGRSLSNAERLNLILDPEGYPDFFGVDPKDPIAQELENDLDLIDYAGDPI